MLRFMGLQRVGHDWVTELNWTSWQKTSSSSVGVSIKLLQWHYEMAAGFPLSNPRKRKQKLQLLFILSLISQVLLFLQYPIGHILALFSVWGDYTGHEYQKLGILVSHFRGWLPQLTSWYSLLPGPPHETFWTSSQHGDKVSRERRCSATKVQQMADSTMVGSVWGYVFRNWYNSISSLFY